MAQEFSDSQMVGFYHKGFTQTIVNTILWSMYMVLFPISLRALFRNRIWSKSNIFLGLTTFAMFVVTNVYFFIFLRLQTSIIEVMLRSNTAGVVLTNLKRMDLAQDGIKGSRVIQTLPRLVNFILGDGVVVHRAFVLIGVDRPNHPILVGLLRGSMVILLLASVATSIYDVTVSLELATKSLRFALDNSLTVLADSLAIGSSFATNLVATLSIGMTTRTQIYSALTCKTPGRNRVARLLILVTETAVFYVIFQFIAIIALLVPAKGGSLLDIVSSGYMSALNVLSALYPTILIVIIGRRNNASTSKKAMTQGSTALKGSSETSQVLDLTVPESTMDTTQEQSMHQWEMLQLQRVGGSAVV